MGPKLSTKHLFCISLNQNWAILQCGAPNFPGSKALFKTLRLVRPLINHDLIAACRLLPHGQGHTQRDLTRPMSKQLSHKTTPDISVQELVRALACQAARECFHSANVSDQLDKIACSPSTDEPCSGDS